MIKLTVSGLVYCAQPYLQHLLVRRGLAGLDLTRRLLGVRWHNKEKAGLNEHRIGKVVENESRRVKSARASRTRYQKTNRPGPGPGPRTALP